MVPYVDAGQVKLLEDPTFSCSLAGLGIMTRKDSAFPELWNKGYQTIVDNKEYQRICEEAATKHPNGIVNCL